GTVDIRGLFHRGAAVVMVALAFYHVWYLIFTKRGRQQLKDFLPGLKDIWDVIGMVKYNLGLSSQRPEFERYNYAEKAEYWALIWGTIVMGITGFILWFPNITMAYFPKWLTDVSTTVHYYEAILATLAIIVWHFYFQFLDPHVYPFNFTCMTGKISEEALREEHKLEYERLESQQETALEE
ncbi:cytochrome b/b6 domain-containing protein, partial [candidate division KSB1 bacterium]|nr:cytochrome b/b6 domain-containing protein [candidate division KSB1 bacterium]